MCRVKCAGYKENLHLFVHSAGTGSLGLRMLSISSGMFVVNSVQPGMRLYEAP